MNHRLLPLLLIALLCPATRAQSPLDRRLYVADASGLSVYDINNNHQLLRKIPLPGTGDYKGIAASCSLGKLYLTSNKGDELLCIDLKTEQIDWRKQYGKYVDSLAITPDGKTLYLPCRHDIGWWVLSAADGSIITKIETERGKPYDTNPIGDFGPHNTWCNPDGSRMYLEVLTVPYVYIADTATHKIIAKVGPFSRGIRPFTVSDDERFVFATVDGLLGFEVGSARTTGQWGGALLYRVEAKTPAERIAQLPNLPKNKPHSTHSHGINITPDQKEVWVVDGVYGMLYAYDITPLPANPPRHLADIPIFSDASQQPKPGWISFGLDGRYAYPDGGSVIDTKSRQIVARIPTSEKLIEIDFVNNHPIKAGHR